MLQFGVDRSTKCTTSANEISGHNAVDAGDRPYTVTVFASTSTLMLFMKRERSITTPPSVDEDPDALCPPQTIASSRGGEAVRAKAMMCATSAAVRGYATRAARLTAAADHREIARSYSAALGSTRSPVKPARSNDAVSSRAIRWFRVDQVPRIESRVKME